MLTEDMAWSMPPLASWYGGPVGGLAEIELFLRNGPLCGEWRVAAPPQHRQRPARRSAPTPGSSPSAPHIPFSLDVITLEGEKIKEVTAFVVRVADTAEGTLGGRSTRPIAGACPLGLSSVAALPDSRRLKFAVAPMSSGARASPTHMNATETITQTPKPNNLRPPTPTAAAGSPSTSSARGC